jgi:class 3 adenylate cyclase/predicted ATPase
MDFYDMLAKVQDLLSQHGRLSYRALKRQFALDDEDLDALKDELIYAKRLAVDEDGRVLVWSGGTSSTPPTASPVPLPATPDVSPAQGEAAPVAPPTPEAERRQLTVLFCDLVASTKLASQLDPEDWRDVVRAYQQVCTEVIQRFDGHIAQLLGDGLLIYFGYPHAHEDDAQRAVRAGLGILAAMSDLNPRLQREKGLQLGVRVGMHTGLVVVGAMGGAGRQEQLALGETPNIAARIEGLAAPDTIAVSEATYRLIQGYFACQDLGAQTLRGVAEPVHVYRVLQASGARGRLDVAGTRGLTPLVGREQEVGLLFERWEQVKAGHGQVVLLTGEAGIGKSRLVQMLKDHVANEPHVRWECRSAEYSQNTALFPHTDLFQRLLQFQSAETPDEKVGKLEQMLSQHRLPLAESVPLFAPLLSLPIPEDRYPALHLSPQRQRQKTLETLVAILLEHAEHHPVLFILEDLHWADPTTLELLNLMIEQIPTTPILTLLTCRPHFQPAWHHRSYLTEMTLNHLSHAQVAQIVTGMTEGKTLPHEVLAQIIAKTDGVPLFVEEMTKAILESGHLTAVDGHYELTGSFSTFAIPATLQDSLMARLDRLVTAKAVAQYAAVIGRQFPYELLQAVSQVEAAMLQHALGRLVEAEIVYQRGLPPQATYTFKHALIQDTAYQSLLKSTRQQYHQHIAQVLEAQFPDTVATQPELLAYHYTEAGCTEQAVHYWQRAGQRAVEHSAYVEAISHLTQGLEVLQTLPDSLERTQDELGLQTALGSALIAIKGYAAPEVEQAYNRARELCQHLGETPRLLQVLLGLQAFYVVRGNFRTAREISEQCLALVQHLPSPTRLLNVHYALGVALFHLGEFVAARAHLEQGMALYDAQQHRPHPHLQDPGVICLAYGAWVLLPLGYPDQSLSRVYAARHLAQQLAHPFSLAFALHCVSVVHQVRREASDTQEQAQVAMTLSTEQGFPFWKAYDTVVHGWALVQQERAEGVTQMHQGLGAWQALGAEVGRTWSLGMLAEAYGRVGQPEAGLTVLAEALAAVVSTEERFWEVELYRLKGELLLQARGQHGGSEDTAAEDCFHHALAIARHQQAKLWELRATTSLSRLWQQQGKRTEAYELLAPIYGWFTEGFDTADLQEAKALLEALA